MKQLNYFLAPLLFISFFTACKKESAFTGDTGGGNTNVPACVVKTDQTDENLTFGNQFTLTYDGNGLLVSVAVDSFGTTVGTVDITTQKIVRKKADLTETFDFKANLFTGKPESYNYSNSWGSSHSRSVTLSYNGSAKVTQAKLFDAGNTLLSTRDFVYDDNDNLKSYTYTSSSAGSVPLLFTATTYDDNNSPFYGQTGTDLLFYSWDYENTNDVTFLFQHLSRHNIQGYEYDYPNGTQSATYQYTYNAQLFPTAIFESISNTYKSVTSPLTYFNWTYTYDCK